MIERIANGMMVFVFLLILAIMPAAVGGLGLMGTMSLNVLERTREIGVMRAKDPSLIKGFTQRFTMA